MQNRNNTYNRNSIEQRSRYDDIITLPHPVSRTHPQMTMLERAAQFSPFAALTGHGDAVRETARLTEELADLDENGRESLDRKLSVLQEHFCEKPEITITYFQPDDRKQGGAYQSLTGQVKKIDSYERKLIMADGTMISMEYIIQMDGAVFDAEDL